MKEKALPLFILLGFAFFTGALVTFAAIAQTGTPDPGHAATEVCDDNLCVTSGQVDVGSSTAGAMLEIEGTDETLLRISDTGAGNILILGTDGNDPGFMRLRPFAGDGFAITDNGDTEALFVDATTGNIGIMTTVPQAPLHVNGHIRSQGIYQVGIGTPTTYLYNTQRYILDATPAEVGKVVPLDDTIMSSFCRDKDGCIVSIQTINAGGLGAVWSRTSRLYYSETSTQWRFDNDVLGTDSNSVTHEWITWDCYFTDAETWTGSANGRADNEQGFGLLNFKGGLSDATTTCRVVIED